MNLALYDVDVLAQVLASAVLRADTDALTNYSSAVLPRIWTYREFSAWITDTIHDAGDPALHGEKRRMSAQAHFDALFSSPAAARLHSRYQRGLV